MTEGPDRRRLSRQACLLSVEYRTEGEWLPAEAVDLNGAGCRLRIGEDLESLTAVSLRFDARLRDGAANATVEAVALVMWCRRQGPSHDVGLQFAATPARLDEILNGRDPGERRFSEEPSR